MRPLEVLQSVSCADRGPIRADKAWRSATSAAQGACVRLVHLWSFLRRALGARILNQQILIVMGRLNALIVMPGSTAQEGLRLPLRAFLAAFQIHRGPFSVRLAGRVAIRQVALRLVLPVTMGSTRTTKARANAYLAHTR